MPTPQKASNDPRDRVVDYLTAALRLDPDGNLIAQGTLREMPITVVDRAPPMRGEGRRRYWVRIKTPEGKVDRDRVFSSEASVVVLLDAIDKGKPWKRKPRGIAAKRAAQAKATTTEAPSAATSKRGFILR